MNSFNAKIFFKAIAKSDITKIIITTALLFVILQSIRVSIMMGGEEPTWFFENIWDKVILSASLSESLQKPWTWITYIFCEMSMMQIIGNMIWLWIFGSVIEDLQGYYRVIPLYLTGGLIAAICLCVLHSFFKLPSFYYAGASPGLVAVATATLIYKPNYKFWIADRLGINMWILGIIFFVLQFASIGNFNVSKIALLFGGILTGVAFNFGLPLYFDWLSNSFKKLANFFGSNDNFVLQKRKTNRFKSVTKSSYQVVNISEQKINMLLDKISASGINSLSKEERKQLEEYSKQRNEV